MFFETSISLNLKSYFFKIIMSKLLSKLLVCILLPVSVSAFAWGLTGHRIVAQIAENHLTSRAQRQIHKILGEKSMVYWANWPDFIKSDTTGVWKPTFIWHFVDIESAPNLDAFRKALEAEAGPNLYTQVQWLQQKIKDKNTTETDRRTDLIFLIHLLGDAAQPLHVGHKEDLGGNKIQVTYFGRKTNLHSVWDTALIDSQKYSYSEYAKLLDVKTRKEVKQIQQGTLVDWLFQSNQLAANIYANTPNGSELGYDYDYKYIGKVETQLLDGGLRLAKVLNDLFA